MGKIRKAKEFALKAHQGQKDDNGKPYVHHPLKVAEILKKVTSDTDLICAAILHDTIEDCNITREELEKEFGPRVARLVNEVTHEGQKDEIGYWFPRLESKAGIMLKFADRLHNLSRMESWSEERQEHFLRKSKFWKSEPKKGKHWKGRK